MSQIEDLVRQALAETPAMTTSTDPLSALERRVRRARRWLAVGAGAVTAAVVTAVVVPLAVLGGNSAPNGIRVAHTPTPSPSAPAAAENGDTVLWPDGAIWVSTDSAGRRWLLSLNDNGEAVSQVGDGSVHESFKVQRPADHVIAGANVIWVVGGGDGGPAMSRVTAITPATGDVATMTFDNELLSFATASGDSLYVDQSDASGQAVDRIDLVGGRVTVAASKPVDQPTEIVTTGDDHIWVRSQMNFVELLPTGAGFAVGKTVEWGTGSLLARGRGSSVVWAYDGNRLIQLSPALLAGCVSCAEGDRVAVDGRPLAVVEEVGAGLYVATNADELDYYTATDRGAGDGRHTDTIPGAHVTSMSPDPAGGVDYVDDQSELIHWLPPAR